MTTTELYSGYASEGKPSSRVLRPPGGGSSNIFGGPEPTPQQQVRQEQQEANKHGEGHQANPTMDAKHEYERNKPKGKAEAPFASFAESGKKSHPDQFGQCVEESQKDADFRCHSVTAYRDAIAQNNAIKQRARGQVQYNPITGEEYPADYGKKEDEHTDEQAKTEESDITATEEPKTETTPEETPAPEAQNTPPKVKTPSVKVRQPPGGKSSGPLW